MRWSFGFLLWILSALVLPLNAESRIPQSSQANPSATVTDCEHTKFDSPKAATYETPTGQPAPVLKDQRGAIAGNDNSARNKDQSNYVIAPPDPWIRWFTGALVIVGGPRILHFGYNGPQK
jgi:hypothetical protein